MSVYKRAGRASRGGVGVRVFFLYLDVVSTLIQSPLRSDLLALRVGKCAVGYQRKDQIENSA